MTTTIVFDTPADLGREVAVEILKGLTDSGDKPYLVGFPAGRSAIPVVEAVIDEAHQGNIDLARLRVVMMDDYVEETPYGYQRIDPKLQHSCVGWALRRIVDPLADLGFTADQLLAPDPRDTDAVASTIRELGGVDLFVMASGQSDGHVALNGPGTLVDATTRIVGLSESTRTDNLSTFPHLRGLDQVPRFGVTLGTGDFVSLCRSVRMVVWGTHKSEAFARLRASTDYDPDWPATVVHRCQDPAILADSAAASTV
jgi:glucosamine-6-phosphate deaminase